MTIPIETIGRVVNSGHVDHQVRVVRVDDASGNFLIFERLAGSDGPNGEGWFDSWVQDETALEEFFVESRWDIDWSVG